MGDLGTIPTWEYLTADAATTDEGELGALGDKGWELVAAVGPGDGQRYVFKRPGPSARERWTLDQRTAVYAGHGVMTSEAAAGDPRGIGPIRTIAGDGEVGR